jgi:hypothetical protein
MSTAHTIIFTRSKPRLNNALRGTEMSVQSAVRAYRDSPETIALQIRFTKQYATANLTFEQARDLATALQQYSEGR